MRWVLTGMLLSFLVLGGCERLFPPLDEIVLHPDREITVTPADYGYEYETIHLPVTEDRSVVAWHIPSTESKALIVVLPGSSRNKSYYTRVALPVIGDAGYDILLVDYEGFGDSPGEPALGYAADDAMAVVAYAMARHDKVILFGISLGTPMAVRTAVDHPVAGLILDSSLVIQEEVEVWMQMRGYDWPVLRELASRYVAAEAPQAMDVLRYAPLAHGAKLFIHSPEDTLTPLAGALQIYDAAAPPKTFWQTAGDHAYMIRLQPDVYSRTVTSWLEAVLEEPAEQATAAAGG